MLQTSGRILYPSALRLHQTKAFAPRPYAGCGAFARRFAFAEQSSVMRYWHDEFFPLVFDSAARGRAC